jgi:hypothetical protein
MFTNDNTENLRFTQQYPTPQKVDICGSYKIERIWKLSLNKKIKLFYCLACYNSVPNLFMHHHCHRKTSLRSRCIVHMRSSFIVLEITLIENGEMYLNE